MAETALVYMPIFQKQRTADGMRVSARLSMTQDVNLDWLRSGLRGLIQSGKAAVRQMGSHVLAPAGRLLTVNESEVVASVAHTGAAKLVDADCYRWLVVTVSDPRSTNGVVVGGKVAGVSIVDSDAAPSFLGKRAGAQYVDAHRVQLQHYAECAPEAAVRAYAQSLIAPSRVTKSADVAQFEAESLFDRLRLEGRL